VGGQVDCTGHASESLCIKYRIDAFPTILVFRKDDTGTSQHECARRPPPAAARAAGRHSR
jgi:hypothetical protein